MSATAEILDIADVVVDALNNEWLTTPAGDAAAVSPVAQYDRECYQPNAGNKRAATGTTATITMYKAHGFRAGDQLNILNAGDAAYNGLKTVLSTPTSTTFTFALAAPKEEAEITDASFSVAFAGTSYRKHAIPDMTWNVDAGGSYRFVVDMTVENTTGNYVGADISGGTATATTVEATAEIYNGSVLLKTVTMTALDTYAGVDLGVVATRILMRGTVTVNAGGTFVPRFFYGNKTARSSVTTESFMLVDDTAAPSLFVHAERSYVPNPELADTETLKVYVVPRALDQEPLTRAKCDYRYKIDLGIMQRYTAAAEGESDPRDALMALTQTIADLFRLAPLTGYTDAHWLKTEHQIYLPDHMDQLRQFTSVLTLTFMVAR